MHVIVIIMDSSLIEGPFKSRPFLNSQKYSPISIEVFYLERSHNVSVVDYIYQCQSLLYFFDNSEYIIIQQL